MPKMRVSTLMFVISFRALDKEQGKLEERTTYKVCCINSQQKGDKSLEPAFKLQI